MDNRIKMHLVAMRSFSGDFGSGACLDVELVSGSVRILVEDITISKEDFERIARAQDACAEATTRLNPMPSITITGDADIDWTWMDWTGRVR